MDSFKDLFRNQKKWMIVLEAFAAVLLGFGVFFFSYYKVTSVEVMDSSYYSEEEIRKMVLQGSFSDNSVLAPLLLSKKEVADVPFVSGYSVTALNRNTLCISLKEELPVGCVPYLGNYVYFNEQGVFTESSPERDERVPFFSDMELDYVIKGEALPISKNTVVATAVSLAGIFRKNEQTPDHIEFDDTNNISLLYGDIEVRLGTEKHLEDKMARVLAILPKLNGKKGILHVESISDNIKTITFEKEVDKKEESEKDLYDEDGNYIGPDENSPYDYAIAAWPGGYDDDGDYTGWGNKDVYGQYVGEAPTPESIQAQGSWMGGYDEEGRYVTTGEFDRNGYYVGPNPSTKSEEEDVQDEDGSEGGYEETYEENYEEDYESEGDESGNYGEDYEEDYNEEW